MAYSVDIMHYKSEILTALVKAVHYTYSSPVDGHIAEFGTMTGLTATALACAIRDCEAKYQVKKSYLGEKHLHLFDSFEGLPQVTHTADTESPLVKLGSWAAGTCSGVGEWELRSMCSRFLPTEQIKIFAGWYKDTVPALPAQEQYSMVHVDCDLYESTIDALTALFSERKISDGCIFLLDDWSSNRCSPAFGEQRAWIELTQKFKVDLTDLGCYGMFSKQFIVHGYSP